MTRPHRTGTWFHTLKTSRPISTARKSSPRLIWCKGIVSSQSILRTLARWQSSPPLASLNSCVWLLASRTQPRLFSTSWTQWVGTWTLFLSTWTISLSPAATVKSTRLTSIPFAKLAEFGLMVNVANLPVWQADAAVAGAHHLGSRCCPGAREGCGRPAVPQANYSQGPAGVHGDGEFYHRFIPGPACTMRWLFALIVTKEKVLTWSEEAETAFAATKEALANVTLLVHPCPEAHMVLLVDASDIAVGGVLEHWLNGQWRPLAFFSKQLCLPELKNSAFNRELLALYLAIRHFQYFLEGRPFTVFMDHKPLTQALAMAKDP
ncbi:uncharacterized protein [Narcine bancroftii]|uniref:uncharacterized protein n=1 Tax=Narcine bancroftii TaxID=1343680 RepID=UPI0038322FB2